MAIKKYGNKHKHIYDNIIMDYMVKELLPLRPRRSPRPRPPISVSKILRAIKRSGYPRVHRTTVIRHLTKLVERHELIKVTNEKRQYNATSFGLILYPVKIGLKWVALSVRPSSS